MSAKIVNSSNGILTVRVSGKLAEPELAAVQNEAAAIFKKEGKMSILVETDNFQGWERAGQWGDLSFQAANDQYIEKLAIVGDKQWEDLALIFTAKGLRKFPIEFFPPNESAKARAWLAAGH